MFSLETIWENFFSFKLESFLSIDFFWSLQLQLYNIKRSYVSFCYLEQLGSIPNCRTLGKNKPWRCNKFFSAVSLYLKKIKDKPRLELRPINASLRYKSCNSYHKFITITLFSFSRVEVNHSFNLWNFFSYFLWFCNTWALGCSASACF